MMSKIILVIGSDDSTRTEFSSSLFDAIIEFNTWTRMYNSIEMRKTLRSEEAVDHISRWSRQNLINERITTIVNLDKDEDRFMRILHPNMVITVDMNANLSIADSDVKFIVNNDEQAIAVISTITSLLRGDDV